MELVLLVLIGLVLMVLQGLLALMRM